jgi:hypothetical protein
MFGEKENTEEKIMKATFDILQREGLAKTTTKKIAAEAGVNEVTIFRKFENKKNLINATKEFFLKKFTDKFNWAVCGYVTYYDNGSLKTAYTNQINIIDRQAV